MLGSDSCCSLATIQPQRWGRIFASAGILLVSSKYPTPAMGSYSCFLLVFDRSGTTLRPCGWGPTVGLACILHAWSHYVTSVLASDNYSLLIFCMSGAIIQFLRLGRITLVVFCLHFSGLEQLLSRAGVNCPIIGLGQQSYTRQKIHYTRTYTRPICESE